MPRRGALSTAAKEEATAVFTPSSNARPRSRGAAVSVCRIHSSGAIGAKRIHRSFWFIRGSFAADHGHALNFNRQSRPRKAADGDERAAGKAFLEYLLAEL